MGTCYLGVGRTKGIVRKGFLYFAKSIVVIAQPGLHKLRKWYGDTALANWQRDVCLESLAILCFTAQLEFLLLLLLAVSLRLILVGVGLGKTARRPVV